MDFKKIIIKPSNEISKFFEIFPQHYNTSRTLQKNEHFMDEIIKHFKKQDFKTNNILNLDKSVIYDIITSYAKINDKKIRVVFDSGANFSIINYECAKELNLIIKTTPKHNLTLENYNSIFSSGICENITIIFINKIYYINAIVLKDSAQGLLLGTDFLGKHKTSICLYDHLMTIPGPNSTEKIQIFCANIANTAIKIEQQNEKYTTCYANEKIILKPYETKIIKLKILYDENQKYPTDSVFSL
ncbi:hypothetical protein GVAV_000992 [Gurleya vavrai]